MVDKNYQAFQNAEKHTGFFKRIALGFLVQKENEYHYNQ